jgi:hypothetical protein
MNVRFGRGALNHTIAVLWLLTAVIASQVLDWQTSSTARTEQDNENRLLLPTLEREELERSERKTRPESRLPLGLIINDFQHLQLLNNKVREGAANHDTDYKKLLKPLGEMRKRAKRLKVGLELSSVLPENEGSPLPTDPDVKVLLTGLDKSVQSFVRNPMFRSTKVLDVRLARLARADLDRVIELSGLIAERIRKGR